MKPSINAVTLLLALVATGCQTNDSADLARAEELVELSSTTVKSFLSGPTAAGMKENLKQCRGVLVFPSVVKGGLVMGATGGGGVLLARNADGTWSSPSFCSMHGVTFGPQAGFQSLRMVLVLMNDKVLTRALEGGFEIGSGLSIAAGTESAAQGASSRLDFKDIVSYTRGEGVYGGLALRGGVLKTEKGMNDQFYGADATPLSIVVERQHENPAADVLITTLNDAGK